jgi:hypothetical protein
MCIQPADAVNVIGGREYFGRDWRRRQARAGAGG